MPPEGDEVGPLWKSSNQKRVGRPVGHRQVPYATLEVATAFDVIMDLCPATISNDGFILKLQKVLATIFKSRHNFAIFFELQ